MNLNSKKYLINEAERMFLYEFISLEEISNRLHLNRKTVMDWKEKYGWEKRKVDFLKSKQCFHEELYEFARKLMKDISIDLDNGEKVDPGRMYAFCRIIPMFTKVKDYEDIVAKKEKKETQKGLTPELIAQIEEEVLGITQNNDNEKE
ncbi:MAG: hypothetical protein LUE64_01465 [Candidatus Gastranaerophilales bacterium]|nr:hypothetical protein [Candidatus Gastranaerophilales bacterium]